MKNNFTKVLNKKITLDSGKEIFVEINMNESKCELIITTPNSDGTTVIDKFPFSIQKENAAD